MEELFLIYVHELGKNFNGGYVYEFIFSDTLDVSGEDWDLYPASGNPLPPNSKFIRKVGRLESDMKFEVIQNSDTFAVWDAVDGVVSLAWEDIRDYDEYPESRIAFKFADSITSVEDKLYENDLILDYNVTRNEKLKGNDSE